MQRRFLILLLILSLNVFNMQAQGTIGGKFMTDDFPEVSFVWHENNPEKLDLIDFRSFYENGEQKKISVTEIPVAKSDNENRYVLILWEDLAYYGANMYNFSHSALIDFLHDYDMKENDHIGISVYSRRRIDEDKYLTDIIGGFSRDKADLVSAIKKYERNTAAYRDFPNRADIFPAISEAVGILHKQGDGVKAIVLITSGYPLDNSSSSSDVNARLLAEKHHVPVYVLQHGRDHGFSAKLSDFAPLTYGSYMCFADVDQKKNIASATDSLKSIFANLSDRYHGHDYHISYMSSARRGGEPCLLEFNINGFEYKEQFIPPKFSFGAFIKDHIILTCVIFLCFICLIVAIVLFLLKRKTKEQEKYEALKNESAKAQSEAFKAISSMEAEIKNRIQEEQQSRLLALMRKRSLYPHLVCSSGDGVTNYTIDKVNTIIGRDSSCDLLLADKRVSRKHARIVFTGTLFELEDTGSTNGLFLNGNIVSSPMALHDGDRINMGGVIITFYL